MTSAGRKVLLIVLLVAGTGGQWGIMQSAAWAVMLANNLRSESVPSALTKTFDGQHPCPICRAIAQAKKSEKKTELAGQFTRLEFLPLEQHSPLSWLDSCHRVVQQAEHLHSATAAEPASPPPRSLPV